MEIMVIVAVICLLGTITVLSLSSMSDRLLLRSTINDIGSALEAAKARSVAGYGGVPHGVHFTATSYTEFSGTRYDARASGNVTHDIDPRLKLEAAILQHEGSVIFSRITGAVGEEVVLQLSLKAEPAKKREIVVGAGGDISHVD